MFRTKTVFILGAGTSVEFDFPSGLDLLSRIRNSLFFRFDRFGSYPDKGDVEIFEALKLKFGETSNLDNVNRLLHAARSLVQASEHHVSIDNALDSLESDDISFVGKLAIAKNILKAEAELINKMRHDDDRSKIIFSYISNSWIISLLKLVTTDHRKSDADKLFENIKIINFNYDRTIDYLLPPLVALHYGLSEDVARTACGALSIYRPYGKLGHLDWQKEPGPAIGFGSGDPASLLKAALELRTFTEQIDDNDVIDQITGAMNWADRIVFLGFGYHRQNIKLLNRADGRADVLGTNYGISSSDTKNIIRELQEGLPGPHAGRNMVELVPAKSGELLQTHGRLLTS